MWFLGMENEKIKARSESAPTRTGVIWMVCV